MPNLKEPLERTYPYLVIRPYDFTGRTWVYYIRDNRDRVLGQIRWFGKWRQYTFYPEPGTIWNDSCLKDIQHFLAELKEARKQKGKVNA